LTNISVIYSTAKRSPCWTSLKWYRVLFSGWSWI